MIISSILGSASSIAQIVRSESSVRTLCDFFRDKRVHFSDWAVMQVEHFKYSSVFEWYGIVPC